MSTTVPSSQATGPVTGSKPVLHQFQWESCFTYLVADPSAREAALIDPRADRVEDYLSELAERGLRLVRVIETHTHADHLSGAAELRRRTGAEVLVSKAARSEVATGRLEDGDTLRVGAVPIEVLASPGHTDDSVTLKVGDNLLTGDALLIGGAGRTDFQNGSAGDLYDTLHHRFKGLPGHVVVWPAHDYQGHTHSTLEHERAHNPMFAFRDRPAMVAALEAGQAPRPLDMDAILEANIHGLRPPARIHPPQLEALLRSPAPPFLLDVRTPAEFRAQHIEGSRVIPLDQLDQRSGELPEGRELILVCRTGARAQLAAARLGARPTRVLEGGLVAWQAMSLPVVEGKKHMSLERQVRVLAGAMAAAGGLLAAFASPWFGLLPAFIGLGLVHAGVTDRCGMALVLGRLPWNQVETEPAAGTCAAAPGGGCAAPLPPSRS